MKSFIYKSITRQDYYLYISEKDNFSSVPEELLGKLGKLEYLFEIDLDKKSRLASADPQSVIENLRNTGYYLQLPPKVY